jgi:hypothetical protein
MAEKPSVVLKLTLNLRGAAGIISPVTHHPGAVKEAR